uniref:K Homology domain-containing protein n=1 Tax=Callorhinchus milii TaxID=7868 RepID=A0A4W3JKN2_CALMI
YKKYWESRDEECLLVGEDPISMDMRVPREVIKAIIGRQGSTIKQLRRDTGARIEVDDVEDVEDAMRPERIVTITGTPVQVCRAGVAIHQLLATKVQVTEELFVPQAAVGRIIGRGGENIRTISRNSGAKILCERERAEPNLDARRLIKITGTQEEVATAKVRVSQRAEGNAFRKTETGRGHSAPRASAWAASKLGGERAGCRVSERAGWRVSERASWVASEQMSEWDGERVSWVASE